MKAIKNILCIYIFLLLPQSAFAHLGHGIVNDFHSGALHPMSGFDHILAMLAVGMLAIRYIEKPIWFFPLTFMTAMTIGGAISSLIGPLNFIEIAIATSVFILGALLFKKERLSFQLQLLLIALFAFLHGYAHGQEMPTTANGFLYSIGFILSTGSLHLLGIYFAKLLKPGNNILGKMVFKTCGLAIMIAGSILIIT